MPLIGLRLSSTAAARTEWPLARPPEKTSFLDSSVNSFKRTPTHKRLSLCVCFSLLHSSPMFCLTWMVKENSYEKIHELLLFAHWYLYHSCDYFWYCNACINASMHRFAYHKLNNGIRCFPIGLPSMYCRMSSYWLISFQLYPRRNFTQDVYTYIYIMYMYMALLW